MMSFHCNRRNFIRDAALLPLGLAAGGMGPAGSPACGQTPIKRSGGAKLKISLNAYSFARLLNDQLRGRGKGMTLFELLDFCAQHDFDAIDPTGYYFPGYGSIRLGTKGVPTDAYVSAISNAGHSNWGLPSAAPAWPTIWRPRTRRSAPPT